VETEQSQKSIQLLKQLQQHFLLELHVEVMEVKGFDFVGFLFPFLRYAIAGMWGKAFLTLAACCTLIGYPIAAWLTGFNFRKYRLEHLVKSGWTIVNDTPKSNAA
jgi:hypothetical protein